MATAKPNNPNAILMAFRKYHTWLGVGLTVFIVTVALTGIYLNHKDSFNSVFGIKKIRDKSLAPKSSYPQFPLSTTTDLSTIPVSFDQALALVREEQGEQTLERIELKNEKGRLIYKVKCDSGEFVVDATTYHSPMVMTHEDFEQQTEQTTGIDWGKVIKDLHTGKLGGLPGRLWVDFIAAALVALSGTGVYLWLIPVLRKRRSARQRAAADAARQAVTQPV